MLADTLFNAALCAVVIICAHNFPQREKRDGINAALILVANWIFCVLPWGYDFIGVDVSPASFINNYIAGSGAVTHEATWAYADAFAAMLIVLIAFRHWWAYALWALYTLQLLQHFGQSIVNFDFALYTSGLDMVFVAMVAVFILIGGKGTLDHVSRIIGGFLMRGLYRVRYAVAFTRRTPESGRVDGA